MHAFRRSARSWLSENEEKISQVGSLKSVSRCSKKTSRNSIKRSVSSSRRSIELKVKGEKARIAELQIEAACLQKEQEVELARTVQVEMNMAKASTKLKIYEESEDDLEKISSPKNVPAVASIEKMKLVNDYVDNVSKFSEEYGRQVYEEEMYPAAEVKVSSKVYSFPKISEITLEKQPTNMKTSPHELVDKMTYVLNHLQAPEPDLVSDDPLKVLFFMTTFAEVVETKISGPRGKLTRLPKYLDGEPKELVSSCIY